jgi:hypothetical protein
MWTVLDFLSLERDYRARGGGGGEKMGVSVCTAGRCLHLYDDLVFVRVCVCVRACAHFTNYEPVNQV